MTLEKPNHFSRKKQIEDILDDLRALQKSISAEKYAIQENINFIEASRSPWSYVRWLFGHVASIDRNSLLELSDFPFPRWQRELHTRLIEVERRKIPGMITPLRDAIIEFILANHPRFLMDFGSGGMEVERQVIAELVNRSYRDKVVFIGVDFAQMAHEIARANLVPLTESGVGLYDIKELDGRRLNEIIQTSKNQYSVILCQNDIFQLPAFFEPHSMDLVFYSKFRHHFSDSGKMKLDAVIGTIAKTLMEFDDYWSWPLLIPQSIMAWNYPVLLNGAIFSRLRDPSKKELLSHGREGEHIKFFKVGSYLETSFFHNGTIDNNATRK